MTATPDDVEALVGAAFAGRPPQLPDAVAAQLDVDFGATRALLTPDAAAAVMKLGSSIPLTPELVREGYVRLVDEAGNPVSAEQIEQWLES